MVCAANFGVVMLMKTSAPRGLELDDMAVDRRLRNLVAFLGDDRRCLGAEAVLEPLEVVLAEIVVLVEHDDLGVRLFLHQVFRIDQRFALIAGLPSDGPRKVLRIVPLGGAGGDEQLRHLLGVQIFLDRGVGRRAERVEHHQHLVALDQLAHLFDGLRRTVGVVVGDELDLAPVDAAVFVDHLEIGFFGLADDAIGGGGAAVGHDVTDLDLGIGRTGVILLLGEGTAGSENECGDRRPEGGGPNCCRA